MSFDLNALKRKTKGIINPLTALNPKKVIKQGFDFDLANVFRTGKTQAKKLQAKQSLLIDKQRQVENIRLAESEDEIGRRKAFAKSSRSGRRSLIKTSESGIRSNNLGGG